MGRPELRRASTSYKHIACSTIRNMYWGASRLQYAYTRAVAAATQPPGAARAAHVVRRCQTMQYVSRQPGPQPPGRQAQRGLRSQLAHGGVARGGRREGQVQRRAPARAQEQLQAHVLQLVRAPRHRQRLGAALVVGHPGDKRPGAQPLTSDSIWKKNSRADLRRAMMGMAAPGPAEGPAWDG